MASDKTTLGDRMKGYEATTQNTLLRRTPVIIRVDGRAFHSFTKLIKPFMPAENVGHAHNYVVDPSLITSPFSATLHTVMRETALALFDQVQNAVFVYTQSDEISILLRDWDNLETQQWFGGNVQKIVSISAGIASNAFNFHFQTHFQDWDPRRPTDLAMFDSRVFNLPKEEVANYFIWRQQDAMRNSIQMYGRHFFSPKEMHGKSCKQVMDMISEAGHIPWEAIAPWKKRGTGIYEGQAGAWMADSLRANATITDFNLPLFQHERSFIENHLQAPGE